MDKSALASLFWADIHEVKKGGKLLIELKFLEKKFGLEKKFHQKRLTENCKFQHPQAMTASRSL